MSSPREIFGSRIGLLLTMVGVAVGLGNVWRFPYMVGKFGGASFVLVYIVMVLAIGVPALMAEWSLGRMTRRGPVGAFERGGLPGGKMLGVIFFFGMMAASGYYLNAIGWVLFHAAGEFGNIFGFCWSPGAILPPETGFDPRSLRLQMTATALLSVACGAVLAKGLRGGIERSSRVLMPLLFFTLTVLMVRGLTLPGAWAGVEWYILKFDLAALTPAVLVAALGQAAFSLSLGGTFMVAYGSYLPEGEDLRMGALLTAVGDLGAGLLAGLAIIPAVIALGMEPTAGPRLIFAVLPEVFARLPAGSLFGLFFYIGLLGAAFLSAIAAWEVQILGLIDSFGMSRRRAVWIVGIGVYLISIPPMLNLEIFVPWDLTFGSGMQTVGALLAAITFGWCVDRGKALRDLAGDGGEIDVKTRWLLVWLRWVVPGGILAVGIWWLMSDVLGMTG